MADDKKRAAKVYRVDPSIVDGYEWGGRTWTIGIADDGSLRFGVATQTGDDVVLGFGWQAHPDVVMALLSAEAEGFREWVTGFIEANSKVAASGPVTGLEFGGRAAPKPKGKGGK